MNLYDRIVEMGIFVAVLTDTMLTWHAVQEKRRQQMKRRFNRLMVNMGLR